MDRRRITLRIPAELIEKADIAANLRNTTRTEIVTEALRAYLDDIDEEDDVTEAVVNRYLADEMEFDVLTEFLG